MTAVFCTNTADRTAETWERALAPFDRLEFALSDGAKGIAKAVATITEARRDDARASTLEHGLDVFHTAMEAHRVLARHWRRAETAWEEAEAADIKVARARQQGVDARGPAGPARTAWREAAAALEQVEHLEGAWRRAHAALELFRPDGRLNDRSAAEAEITAALPGLPGTDWSKVRNFLRDRRSLAFLDRIHRRLESAEPLAMTGTDSVSALPVIGSGWPVNEGREGTANDAFRRNDTEGASQSEETQPLEERGFGRPVSASGGPITERAGFEPARHLSASNGLANRRFRPLSHLSDSGARRMASPSGMTEIPKPTRPGPRPSSRGTGRGRETWD